MLSIIRVFFIFGIRPILGEVVCMQHIDNSTTDSLSRTTSCHAGFFIILWISALISRDFISFASQSKRSTIDYLTKSAHFILFIMGQYSEVLAVFFYQETSGQHYYGTIRGYIQRSAEMSKSRVYRSVDL